MQENNKNPNSEDFLKDLPVQAEEIGFKPDEMLACGQCSRTNPPNRLKCLYCGAELEITDEVAASLKPNLRKLENWENGFNLIYTPKDEDVSAETIAQIAKITGPEKEILQKIFDAR